MEQIETRLTEVERQIPHLATRDQLAEVLQSLNKRFDAIDARFDAMEERFNGMDERLNAMDARFDAMDERLDAMDTRFDAADDRFSTIDTRLETLADAQHATNRRLDDFKKEQRDYNDESGRVWERLDRHIAWVEENDEQLFRKVDSIEIALENRGITLN